MASTTEMREQVKSRVIERAQRDEAFRELLSRDPRGAVAAELGGELPTHVTVKVVNEGQDELHIVLPPAASGELRDEDLEAASGGADVIQSMY